MGKGGGGGGWLGGGKEINGVWCLSLGSLVCWMGNGGGKVGGGGFWRLWVD